MKITGTKKLLIILFALTCALAACIGVVISRAVVKPAYAETCVYSADAETGGAEGDNTLPDGVPEEETEKEELAEEEYDERFDEHTIRQVADLLDTYPEVVNFYCRVNNVDAREFLALLLEDEQKEKETGIHDGVEYFGHSETGEELAPDEASGYASEEEFPEEEPSYNEQLTNTLRDFRVAYENGEITAPEGTENKDWYIDPDDMGQYATTWYFTGYNNSTVVGQIGFSIPTGQLRNSRTFHHPNKHTASDKNMRAMYWEYYVELAPGESYKITRNKGTNHRTYLIVASYTGNTHWAYSLCYYTKEVGTSTFIIDGDAPSGAEFWVYYGIDSNVNNGDGGYIGAYGRGRFSWNGASGNNHATYGRTAVADNNANFYNYFHRCSHYVGLKFIVKRTNPVAPTLVDDSATNGGTVDIAKNKKTANYEGSPVLITINHDFGAGIIGYDIDDAVTLKSRSMHGVNKFGTSSATSQTGGANVVFQCSTAGVHTIKIKLIQSSVATIPWPGVMNADGNAGATMVSTKMSWKDASGSVISATEITFTLEIKLQETAKPSMVRDSDGVVNGYGTLKTVNYDGDPHTVTFENCDPAFVGVSTNGLTQASWDANTKKLTLQQTERGTYTINLYLLNPAGVTWQDGSTDSLQFTFKIDNQLIIRPTQVGTTSYSKTVSYNGEWQHLTISPALEEQLVIVTTGLKYDVEDLDGDGVNDALAFKMQESGEGRIMIMPAEGYVWSDNKSDTITFIFTIEAVEVPVPKLLGFTGTTKTVTFNPETDWRAELVITDVPRDAINIITALQYDRDADWLPKDVYDGKVSIEDMADQGYTEFDYNVLTLHASDANTYPVTFSLTSPNYRWAVGSTVPTYYLIINRYVLKHPTISDYEYTHNKDKIEGATKTVYYNTESKDGNYTDNADKYYKLFVGGFTANSGFISADQITIRYSADGLREAWPKAGEDGTKPTPELTLWGTTSTGSAGPAGNYIIYITPTSNYIWDTGNDDMYTYKFVITPIYRDQLRMYTQQGEGNSFVIDGGDRTGTADYDGEPKFFRIGSPDNPTQFFSSSQVRYKLVNQAYEPVSPFGGFGMEIDDNYPPIIVEGENGETVSHYPSVLMCSAVEAGTYIVKVSLINTNYAWRDGSGSDIYYTFTIKAQSIKDPEILGSECSGGSDNSLKIYETYIHCGFNGAPCQLVISVPNIKNSVGESIVKVFTNPSGQDIDPDTGKDALQQISWSEAEGEEGGIARLVLQATIVGDHRVLLMIEDENFKWETDCEYYAFELRIDYAEVDDVLFHYGSPDDIMTEIGGNGERYSETYDPDRSQYITVTRSTDEFKTTPFKSQFNVVVSYKEPSYESKSETYTSDSLILEFKDANIYYISVYLTANYRWKSNHRYDTAVQMTFQINAKHVSLPQIVDNETSANVNQGERTKTVTYDTGVTQNIALYYGDDYKAFTVDESQNYPASLRCDNTVIKESDKMQRYTAVDAGTYKLALVLTNTNNYSWSADETVFYQLVIEQRAISIPDAFYISADDLDDRHNDYLDIKEGRKGEAIDADPSGAYVKTVTYDTALHYIYLFGYALENQEVTVTITAKDPSTVASTDIGHANVSVGSVTRGHYAFARTVNVYTVSVAFVLNKDFRQPNCHWYGAGVADSEATKPREFTLVIEKLGIALPYLVDDPTQEWADDDSLSAHFTYDGALTGPSVQIANCLSSSSKNDAKPFMKEYVYDNSRTEFGRDESTDVGTFSITKTANVGIDYILTIVLDANNEYWIQPDGDTTDVKDKLIKIIIDKKAIDKPVVVDTGDGAIYGTNGVTSDLISKTVTYNGSVWTDALLVTGFNTSQMTWVISENATSRTEASGDLLLSTKTSDAGSYTVTITLRDTQNYKWAETADDSNARVLSLIVEPKKIAKPTIVTSDCDLDPNLLPADVFESSDGSSTIDIAKTIYMRDPSVTDLNNIKGLEQTIVIANFLLNDPDGTMSVVTSSSDKFTSNSIDEVNNWLIYKAINAGTYTLKFSLTGNVAWNDGTGTADHFITLTISKREYTAPSIEDPGLTLPTPAPTVSADGLTRTVTFNYDYQKLVITDYDNKIMSYHGKTDNSVTGEPLVNKETVGGANTYTFEAQGAGEYSASFLKRNFTNECWTDVTGDTITFNFVINKLELAVPVIDVDADFLLKGESATASQFTTTYDTLRHSVLALNVLNTDYMTYRMGGDYNTTTAPDTFIISSEAIAQSFSGSVEAGTKVLDKTVDDIYNVNASTKRDGQFQNATINLTTLVDKENFILMEATEPGTYEVIFSLKNSDNFVWAGGTDTDKKVTFKINKVILSGVPQASAPVSKTYTGSPLQFKITNANNGKATSTSTPAFEYEWATVRCIDSATNESMEIVSWYGNELIVQATEIGQYEVKVYLNEKYVQWGSSTPVQTFKFSITKSAVTPSVSYGNAIYLTADKTHAVGDPDAYTTGLLDAGGSSWAKSRTASAFIKLPGIRVNSNTGALDVDGIALEIYYTNPSKPGVKIYSSSTHVFMPPTGVADAAFLAGLVAGDPATPLNGEWSIEAVASGSEIIYNLIFEYKIVPSTLVNEDGTLKKGNYTLHVDQNNTANSYVINSATRDFTVEADPSPFSTASAEKFLVWELYKTSDPDTVVRTYTLADFVTDGVPDFTMWGKAGDPDTMQESNAIELDYLENDAYMFKVNFDSDGLQGPDLSATPATSFMNALVRWEVKWNGVYGGTPNAKYASKLSATSAPYSVSVTIEAKDPDAFSFATTTYTFYYHIKPILYDLSNVKWDYDSDNPFVFDGKNHTVKLTNLPAGLSVSSYDVTGFDRNVQIYAKSEADHGTSSYYETSVLFTTANPNYVIPVNGDTTTYNDPTSAFEWSVKWEIEKQEIKVQWQNEKSENGTTSEYIPYLLNYDKMVTYSYFKDDGSGKDNHAGWPQVYDFSRPADVPSTNFKVVATLKTNADDPALDYANNYKFDTDDFLLFELGPTTKISVNVKLGNFNADGTPDVSSFNQIGYGVMPDHDCDPMVNTVVYNEKPFDMYILPEGATDTDGIATSFGAVPTDENGEPTITVRDNLIITYYNTVNKYRPISAPTDPGSYIIKLQFKDLPDDGNSYELAMTEFYFDIVKGTIDPESYYWRYTHTEDDGTEIVAKYSYDDRAWYIHHTSNSVKNPDGTYSDPAGLTVPEIGREVTEFVYNSKTHKVELFSEDTTILVTNTRNSSGVNAGEYKSTASFSYNGKLWNAPDVETVFDWKIEKKTLSLADVKWVDASAFEFTVSGGEVKTFTMSASGLDPLLISYTSYKTYLESDWLAGDLKDKEISNTQSNAGTYVTELVFDESFDEANPNYQLGNDWPVTIPNPIHWTIAKHEIDVPVSNGSWTEFDGNQHDLLSAISLDGDWTEYFTLVIYYDDGTSSYRYNGEEEYGNEYFAVHAGKYIFSFSIIENWNASNENVVWKVDTGLGYDYVTDDQENIELVINKAAMKVDYWNQNDEASTAVFEAGAFNYNNFVDYRFYFNNDSAPAISVGDPATLLDVLTVAADTHFVIEVFVKDAYTNDMEIIGAGTDSVRLAFMMKAPSMLMSDQIIVPKLPYIEGFETDGVTRLFTDEEWKEMFIADTENFADVTEENYDEWLAGLDAEHLAINKSLLRVNVTYNSKPITFLVHDWETGATYKNHLTIWQGELTQNAAGDYSVSFMFVKDLNNPRCWSAEDVDGDGVADTVDRSPVTLNYRVSYRMIPTFRQEIVDNFPTYTGSEIDILKTVLGEAEYDAWIAEYGKYFEIFGSKGTEAGGYTLQLKILDEYINTIRWDNGKATGQPGTFVIKWKILPIYLIDPNALSGNNSSLVYNGEEQTVFTILGLSENGSAEELAVLRQYANITGDRGVNADNYTAYFTLLNTNYAWFNPITNTESGDSDKRAISWTISPKPLDLSGIKWDYSTPHQYTLENGEAQPFEVKLAGIPEELNEFISYLTDGLQENQRTEMGTYRTVVYLFNNDISQSSNYRLTGSYQEFTMNYPDPEGLGFASIEWKIIEHQFAIPEKTKVVDYSGTLRDIMEDPTLFGFEEGWQNYLDVNIMYKQYGADDSEYSSYYDIASVDELLEYSMFNALYTGDYEVTFTIKSEVNATNVNVVWFDGNNHTGDQISTLTIRPKVINVTGWQPVIDDDGMQVSAVIVSDDFYAMSQESQNLFNYVISDMATGNPVDEAQVKASGNGIYYTVEFKLTDGNGYSAKYGFEIVWAEGVKNPYEFVNENYGSQPVIWVPLPSLTSTSSDTYDGKPKKFTIDNVGAYTLTEDMKTALAGYGVNVDDFSTLIQAIGKNADFVDFAEGTVSVPKAGDFEISFRQLANVNISWFDPDLYEVNAAGKLCHKGGSQLSDADANKLINRYAQNVEISIKKASVDYITDEMIELYKSMIPDLEYTGQEYNLKTLDETKELFELISSTYGDLVTFEGYTGTDAGEHILRIMLTDPDSSYWNLKVSVTDVVNDKDYAGYDPSYSLTYVDVDGKWVVKYLNAEGEEYNGGDYKIANVIYKMTPIIEAYVDMDGLLDDEGKPLDEGKYEVDENGVAVRYANISGTYVKDAEGTFLAKFKLRADGTVSEIQQFDEKGRGVIDTEKTQVTITYVKTSTDSVDIPWRITSQTLSTPTVNEDVVLRFNGTDQHAESVLKGFNPTYMEIVEGGIGKNAGTYTAKIGIKDENFVWRDSEDGYVYVTWEIQKATVDWTGVTWKFTDGVNEYKDGEGMVYTRKDNAATVYWVELANLPQALQGSIMYTTNGIAGAYAGKDAGKYSTTFKILGLDTNFENVSIPEELLTVEWKIQRRVLDVPEIGSTQFIFDDEAHDLFTALKLPENWEEYITINVLYASNFISFVNYGGYEGEPFMAHGAGAYKFVVSFKEGVNVYNLLDSSKSQINVVWGKSTAGDLVPVPPVEGDAEEVREAPAALNAEAPVAEAEAIAVTEEVITVQEIVTEAVPTAVRNNVQTPAVTAEIRQVCDAIKRMICCTEGQLNFRKQY